MRKSQAPFYRVNIAYDLTEKSKEEFLGKIKEA